VRSPRWATPLSDTTAPTQDQLLQRSESSQVGDAIVCDCLAPTKVEVLQRGEDTQQGDAVCL
jgi:hypothetical protein